MPGASTRSNGAVDHPAVRASHGARGGRGPGSGRARTRAWALLVGGVTLAVSALAVPTANANDGVPSVEAARAAVHDRLDRVSGSSTTGPEAVSPEVASPFSMTDGTRDCIRRDNSFSSAACDIRTLRVVNTATTVTITSTYGASPRINSTDGPLWEIDDPATSRVPDFTVVLFPLNGHIQSVTTKVSSNDLTCSTIAGTRQMPPASISGATITQQVPKRCLPGVSSMRLTSSILRVDDRGAATDLAPNWPHRPRVGIYTPVINPA